MIRAHGIDQAIVHDLTTHGTCQVEDMIERLAGFTWNQVFSAIDRLSRDGTVALQRPARFGYEISITSGRKGTLEAGALDEGSNTTGLESEGAASVLSKDSWMTVSHCADPAILTAYGGHP